ncbi:MAG: DUF1800 family protein, partial [Candidatus Hydrogenedentales bacterium]
TWFVHEDIAMDHAAVGELATYFATTAAQGDTFNVRETLRKLLKSEFFYDPQYRYRMFKNPADFMASALRSLEIDESSWSSSVFTFMRDMGMTLFEPPNVAGWIQGERWINSSNLIARFNYGDRVSGTSRMGDAYVDDLLANGALTGMDDHAGMIEYFRGRLIHEPLTGDESQPLMDFLTGFNNTISTTTFRAKIRGLAHLFLTMPRYQLK